MRRHRNNHGAQAQKNAGSPTGQQSPKNFLNPTATNGQTNNKRAQAIVNRIIQQFASRYRITIDEWRNAIKMAEDPFFPKRDKWGQVMRDLVLDAHWSSQVTIRKLAVMGKQIRIVDKATGKENPDKTRLYQAPWFYHAMDTYLDSEFYGTQVMEVEDLLQGNMLQTAIYKIPIRNIIPEKQQILLNSNMQIGYFYGDDPYVIEAKEKIFMGLLSKAAPYLIWKKLALQSWSEFCEKFGIPMRYAKTNKKDQQTIDRLEKMLGALGSAAQAVFPEGTEIDFVEPKATDVYMVFDKLIDRCNSEISKLVNGVTMLSDNGSSKSQSQTHMDVNKQIIDADCQGFISWVNWNLNPKLKALGWAVDPATEEFQFDRTETLGKKDQWTIVEGILKYYDIDPKYIQDQFGVTVTAKKAPTPPEPPAPPVDPPPNPDDPTNLDDPNFKAGHSKPAKSGRKFSVAGYKAMLKPSPMAALLPRAEGDTINSLFLKAAKTFFSDKNNKPSALNEESWNNLYKYVSQKMWGGVTDGYGKSLASPDLTSADEELLIKLRENMYVFSAFKNFQLMQSLNDALKDENGKLREWADFKAQAQTLGNDFNNAWLQTEYDTAVASAQSAARWQMFYDQRAEYNLKFQTAGDNRVRPAHQDLEGKVLAVDDPLLDTLMTPLAWRCRCEWIQIPVDQQALSERSSIIVPSDMPDMFKNNVGKTGQIFNSASPYWEGVSENDQRTLTKLADKTIKDL